MFLCRNKILILVWCVQRSSYLVLCFMWMDPSACPGSEIWMWPSYLTQVGHSDLWSDTATLFHMRPVTMYCHYKAFHIKYKWIYKSKLLRSKFLIFFLFLHENKYCGYWGASNEYPTTCFCGEIRKIFTGCASYLELCIYLFDIHGH